MYLACVEFVSAFLQWGRVIKEPNQQAVVLIRLLKKFPDLAGELALL